MILCLPVAHASFTLSAVNSIRSTSTFVPLYLVPGTLLEYFGTRKKTEQYSRTLEKNYISVASQ